MKKGKNPAAVALGRLGGRATAAQLSRDDYAELGKKGAKSRSETLTPEQRKEIARKAVLARWAKAKAKVKSGSGESAGETWQAIPGEPSGI